MNATNLLLEEKKRSLGLSFVSKAAVGLAAILPAVALATPASGVFTPDSPVPLNDTAVWDPFSTYSSTSPFDFTGVLSLRYYTGGPSPVLMAQYTCATYFSPYSVSWATTGGTEFAQFLPGDTIDSSLTWANANIIQTPDFTMADGAVTYFGYDLFDQNDSTDSYGWVQLNYTVADGFTVTQWGTNYVSAATIPGGAVPEPSTYALIFGLAFAGLAVAKRWQRRVTMAV